MARLGDWSEDLRLAHALVDTARDVALAHLRDGVTAKRKDDGSIVTAADEAAERAVREVIADARPADAVLGEELGQEGEASRRWIVDPIDGTSNYASGRDNWGPLVALEVDGEVVLGVAEVPMWNARWWASAGTGAFRNSERLHVTSTSMLAEATIAVHKPREVWAEALERRATAGTPSGPTPRVRQTGPDYYPIEQVAEGRLDVFIAPHLGPWDMAPIVVLVEEAGGRFSDLEGGRRLDTGGVVLTNGLLHDEVLGALGRST
jgi:histidinol-phosphatase